MEHVYDWIQRCLLWTIVTGGIFVALAIALYGLYGHPSGVPVWVGFLISSVIGLPSLSMLLLAYVYMVRAARARRRDIKAGWVVHTNRVAEWVDYHGIGVGLAVVAIILGVAIWLVGHGVKIGRS